MEMYTLQQHHIQLDRVEYELKRLLIREVERHEHRQSRAPVVTCER